MIATRFAVAIHILVLLAYRQRGVCGPAGRACLSAMTDLATSHLIADSVNTNPVVVRRITGQLARAGLVRVRRGPGGAELTRSACSITLCDVWQAMNTQRAGPMLPLHATPNPDCPVGQQIHGVLGETFAGVERAVHRELSATTLAALMERVGPLPVSGGDRDAIPKVAPARP